MKQEEQQVFALGTEGQKYILDLLEEYSSPFCSQSLEDLSQPLSTSLQPKPLFLRHIFEKEEPSNQIPDLFSQYCDDEINLITKFHEESDDSVLPSPPSPAVIKKYSYSQETRMDKLKRYRLKKSQRIWKRKTIYDCRKDIANTRQRVRGRFTRKDSSTHSNKGEGQLPYFNNRIIPIEQFFQHIKELQEFDHCIQN